MNHGPDFATKMVADNNETIAWCTNILSGCGLHYRPMTDILSLRNAYMHDVMHYRSHQQEY